MPTRRPETRNPNQGQKLILSSMRWQITDIEVLDGMAFNVLGN